MRPGVLQWQDNGPKKVACNGWGAEACGLIGFESIPASCPTYTWEKDKINIHVRSVQPADLHASMSVDVKEEEIPLYAAKFDRDLATLVRRNYREGLMDPMIENDPEHLDGFLAFPDLKSLMEEAAVNAMGAVLDARIETAAFVEMRCDARVQMSAESLVLLVDNFLQRWELGRLAEDPEANMPEDARHISGIFGNYWLIVADRETERGTDWKLVQLQEDGTQDLHELGDGSPASMQLLMQFIAQLARRNYVQTIADVERVYREVVQINVYDQERRMAAGETVPTLHEVIEEVYGEL